MTLVLSDLFPDIPTIPDQRKIRLERSIQGLLTRCLTSMDDSLPFIITGDIPAMWLRDSTWQVKPLLHSNHPDIKQLLTNISKTQVKLFQIDPYANAYNQEPNGNCWHKDFEDQSPWVFERKFELDSWASILYLARKIYETHNITEHFNEEFTQAVSLMLELARKEQHHDPESYVFYRPNEVTHDSLSHLGRGAPTGYTGMIYSGFRPSDDACVFNYHVPSNLFFANELERLRISGLQQEATLIAGDIRTGIENYAIQNGIYAYEVDGLGNSLFMDDANVPSLLSLPYLEVLDVSDALYKETRKFILSKSNPYYFTGKLAQGIGSQHTPHNHVWPISIAIQGLTTDDVSERMSLIESLESTDAKTGYMHESFHVDDDAVFTRAWFSWADMTYLDLVLSTYEM